MPFRFVEYLKRPVRVGKDERQKEILRNAASKALKEGKGKMNRNMLIIRLNQPYQTYEQALAQTQRIKTQSDDAKRKRDLKKEKGL